MCSAAHNSQPQSPSCHVRCFAVSAPQRARQQERQWAKQEERAVRAGLQRRRHGCASASSSRGRPHALHRSPHAALVCEWLFCRNPCKFPGKFVLWAAQSWPTMFGQRFQIRVNTAKGHLCCARNQLQFEAPLQCSWHCSLGFGNA